MSKEKKNVKISDNPTSKEIKGVLPVLKLAGNAFRFLGKLGINKEKFAKLGAMSAELEEQAKILEIPDRFNEVFGQQGWICVGSALSVTVMQDAIDFAKTPADQRHM